MSSLSSTRTLHTHASIRIEPPQTAEGKNWIINSSPRRRFLVSVPTCALLISFMGGRTIGDAVSEVAQLFSVDSLSLERLVHTLEENELIVESESEMHNWALQIKKSWSLYGWNEAANYQIASYNYPFVNYGSDGRSLDIARMDEYSSEEPDVNRVKPPMDASKVLPVIPTRSALNELTESFGRVWLKECNDQQLDAERLELLLSTLFGKLRHRKVSVTPNRADLIRKTSPSGGSRHPTEGYVFVLNVEGIAPGIYHFSVAAQALEQVGTLPDNEVLLKLFSGPIKRAQFEPEALLVMTTYFERNMYRYREPRTFRSVFMDIGHLCVTMETVASSLGLKCQFQHAIDDEQIESLLGVHSLEEGAMFGAALAGGAKLV
ncbi:SagB/ThcOx family dehydrogenase [Paenibacillus polysaccharolyticus]|uniref:SagB/ThcOx family dehydrogenase n=1 Tax=Paenibacillus polysaccharolyticus TaxID=582692 RepID=UPI00209E9608|nr:SagB/ThcOx family dehydrogenase [Paenibacillus polysaccharolyticus]MCP1133366.1 SagB/ThcOx family dehydrogenase [Paenibacillus polysaccharolyticus]